MNLSLLNATLTRLVYNDLWKKSPITIYEKKYK